jgi:DNA-binding transcriptional MerR regulator
MGSSVVAREGSTVGEHVGLHIAEVADSVGMSLRTIRLYDETGVAPPSARSDEGSGLYSEADIDRLRLVKRLKPLDLDIEEVAEVVDAFDELASDGTSPERRRALVERLSHFTAVAEERAAHLRQELIDVEAMTDELRRAVLRGRSSLHHPA